MRPESVEICLFDKEDNDRGDDLPFSNLPDGDRGLIIRPIDYFSLTKPLKNLDLWEKDRIPRPLLRGGMASAGLRVAIL